MIKLVNLLKLQLIYAFTGIGFNLFSLALKGDQTLTPTAPQVGVLVMIIYSCFLLLGYYKHIVLYRMLMGVSVLGFGYSGVVKHFVTFKSEPELYPYYFAFIIAVGINLFGCVLNLLAVFKKFKI